MKSIKTLIYSSLLVAGALSSSCYKDLGNYNYKDVNNFVVDSFPPSLFVYQFDTLKLTPKIAGTMENGVNYDDSSRFKYRWLIGGVSSASSVASTTLGNTRILNARITPSPGNYGLYFEMRDLKTGQIFMQHCNSLTIGSSTYEGWIVFSDIAGNAQLDMINYINGETRITRDILSISPDIPRPLKGPRKVAYINSGVLNAIPPPYHNATSSNTDREWIYITSDQGSWKLRNDYFYTQGAWNSVKEFVSSTIDSATFKPQYHGGGEANNSIQDCYMVDGNEIYERAPNRYYVVSVNRMLGEGPFRAAPFIGRAYTNSWTENTVFFDIDRKRFVRSYPESGYCTAIPTPSGTQLWDFNNVGMDMVWMRSVDEINLTYALMKDPANAYWLLVFDARTTVSQILKIKITSPEIEKAKFYTIDKTTGVLYYATESKVYAINKDFPGTYNLVLDAGSSKITWMDEHPFTRGYGYYNGDAPGVRNTTNREPYKANWIGVATYDASKEAGAGGTLSFYYSKDYQSAQAAFVKKDEYKGFGKIVSVSYRERPL